MNFNIVSRREEREKIVFEYRWVNNRLEVWSDTIGRFVEGDLHKARSRASQFECLDKFEAWYQKVSTM